MTDKTITATFEAVYGIAIDVCGDQLTLHEITARVDKWVMSPEGRAALKKTSDRARKTSESIIKQAAITDEQLRQRVTI